MKNLLAWFNDRSGFGDWCGRLADSPVSGRACWCKVWPATILFAFCIQAVTGFFLWVYYSPSAQTAWESVYFLQTDVAGGWLLRAIHHYSAHVLLALLILYVVQIILTGAYRAPRELVFWATVGLGLCALAAVLTGDLLSWDQNGYAATKTRTGFLTFLPLVGEGLLKIAIGGPGPALGHLTLTRFFALHVGVFSAAFALLLIVRGVLARRASAQAAAAGNATPYWPAQAWRSAVACLVVMGVVLLLACQHGTVPPQAGATLLSPADTDPANSYDAARPEWFLVGVYEFSHFFAGQWAIIPIFIVPGLLVVIVLAMPFLAQRTIGQVFNVVFTIALLVALVGMSYYSLAKDRANQAHQTAIALEKQQAQRVCELARHEGIPPTGALTLLRNDPKTQGRRLFLQNCASCHPHSAGGDLASVEDIKLEKPLAPDLHGFATRPWIAGLLNPKEIVSPRYFGNTKLRSSKMVTFVKETLGDLDAGEKKKLQKAVMALSAEAKLPSQSDLDKKDIKAIEEGRELIAEFGCTDCHKFRDKGKLGDAPELTGYGSPEWTAGIIGNPAAKRFYGKLNDRMPAYASSPDTAKNALNPQQIKMLTEWLRGQWYRETNM
jgi:ubiquinol-cytochrome c reductase cytochrome b subunit